MDEKTYQEIKDFNDRHQLAVKKIVGIMARQLLLTPDQVVMIIPKENIIILPETPSTDFEGDQINSTVFPDRS